VDKYRLSISRDHTSISFCATRAFFCFTLKSHLCALLSWMIIDFDRRVVTSHYCVGVVLPSIILLLAIGVVPPWPSRIVVINLV
jgi:hypothetical protein